MNQGEGYMAVTIKAEIQGVTADDTAAHLIGGSEFVVVELGPDCWLYFESVADAREVLVVDLGRKLAHLEVEHAVDQTVADTGEEL